MARYVNDIFTDKSADTVKLLAEDFFHRIAFVKTNLKGEEVWKKGAGIVTSPQFIKIEYGNGKVHIEAWLKFAWLPGVYSGEMDLTGFFGIVIKKALESQVKTLENLIRI